MDEKGMTNMRRGLAARAVMVAILMVGCARTPATTTSAPSPTGAATSGTSSSGSNTGTTAANRAGTTTGNLGSTGSGARVNPGDYAVASELADVHFDFDKYEILPAEATLLDSHAAWLKQNGDRLILIEGHCDERGTTEYNVALGERRAKATMNYLVSQGIQANRITIISYGEERPVCSEKTEACWSKNRRANFLVKPR